MKKTLVIFSLLIVACIAMCISINAIMVKNVESVKKDFFDVVCDKKKPSIDYGALLRYDYTRKFEIKKVDNLALKINSAFYRNGKGYMNVQYSFDINKDDRQNMVGAGGVESKWYIEKQNGRWIVVDIEEAP